ncbi:MAG TPA: hypothetical protein VMW75_02660, partial [Thermoanaerobaculia bacterium]|nr:hypothetical protein [Thermoanaerobaculia bacterium]
CHPALVWERVVWRQELAAVAPAAHSTLGEDLESLAGSLSGQSGSPWRRLLQLRQGLTRMSADESGGELIEWSAVAAPWFPADSPLQRPLQCEARADLHYLEGRRWLRSGAPQRALERFRRAREALGGEGPARFLAKLRLASVLAYWEGVALAHLGRLEEARDCLVPCRRGVKAIEAEVQLGMLALSAGDTAAASECLARVPQPLPPPACYLAALVAEREGRADETQQEVDRALAAGPSPRGVYAAAAWRLHGRLAEREGRAEEAAEAYRQALDRWPADRAAIVRLGRVRLRTELPRLGTGAAWRHDPALAALGEAASAIAWARPMAELREWLLAAEPGEEMHPPLPGAPAGRRRRSSRTRRDGARPPLPPQPAGPALERLALRLLLGAGRRREAAERASAWCATDHEDLALAAAAAVLATALVLQSGAASGGAPARWAAVEGLAGRLASLRLKGVSDPAVSFWHDATRLALAPELAATGELCVAAPADGGPPQRAAFAAVVRLFSSDAEWRRNAAEACRELLAEGAFAERSQHDAVAFLVAMAGADDDELVARYTAVEAHLETVPCVASDAYVTASEARLRSGAVDAVTHGAIPDSLAELDDPEVRRVVGLAYALRAARRAERDPRGALNEAGQAIELLTAKG